MDTLEECSGMAAETSLGRKVGSVEDDKGTAVKGSAVKEVVGWGWLEGDLADRLLASFSLAAEPLPLCLMAQQRPFPHAHVQVSGMVSNEAQRGDPSPLSQYREELSLATVLKCGFSFDVYAA